MSTRGCAVDRMEGYDGGMGGGIDSIDSRKVLSISRLNNLRANVAQKERKRQKRQLFRKNGIDNKTNKTIISYSFFLKIANISYFFVLLSIFS